MRYASNQTWTCPNCGEENLGEDEILKHLRDKK